MFAYALVPQCLAIKAYVKTGMQPFKSKLQKSEVLMPVLPKKVELKSYLIFIFVLCSSLSAQAQLNASVIGDAIDQGNNCYIITPDEQAQSGGVWYNNPIDFDLDFSIYYQNNFGFKDLNGADGMALVFKGNPTPVIGGSGGGLGYEGIAPSLIIEFDTYLNTDFGDPTWDHIAIMRDGNADHTNGSANLSGPVQASSTSLNIEDGNAHEVRIEWNATTNTLSVFFDCLLRLTLNQNIKNTIFAGDDSVFFGFVGSTGGLSNLHKVCFNRISFVDNLQIEDEVICETQGVQVIATIPSGISYSWIPTAGVSDPTSPTPFLSPTVTTTYTVTISDICGQTISEEITVTVLPISNTEPVFDPVPPICEGDPLNALPTTSNDGIIGFWTPALDNTTTTNYTFTPSAGQCVPETTLIIIVTPTVFPAFSGVNPVCPGEFLPPLPTTSNNGITGTWVPIINNMVSTLYTFTPNPGQGCTTTSTLLILIKDPIIPTFDDRPAACIGGMIDDLPTTSNEGITGTWSPALNNMETTLYSFDPNPNQCASDNATLQITIIPISELVMDVELILDPFDFDQTAVITVTGGTGSYEYQVDNSIWVAQNVFGGLRGCRDYVLRARETSGCSTTAVENIRTLHFPNFFTPNGDGINDVWNIDCLEDQPEARIVIYDRYGKILGSIRPSGTGWDGRYNRSLMPSNDYWFTLEYTSREGLPKIFKSHFTLKR
ncbi:MAG: gliding motility-associated-like protein [Patiriisocius sp.]